MRPVSDAFLNTVRGSHRAVFEVRVLTSYQEGVSPTGVNLDLLDGDVTYDASADVRATVQLTVEGTNGFTRDPAGLLTPYGNEVWVARGVVYGNGTRELVSQGYYRLYAVEQDERPDFPIRLDGRDRMSGLIDGRLEAPRQFVAGTSVLAIVTDLVTEIYPNAGIDFDYDASTDLVQVNYVADQDRYVFLRDLVNARGKVMYFDHRGRLQVRDAPSPTTPVFEVNAGTNGVLVTASRRLDREGVYNAVVALGETPTDTTEPVRAVARDVNPNSPTYYFGRFGKVPRFYQSPFITTNAQAQSAAEKILAREIGLPYSIDFSLVPNSALETLDLVRVTLPEGYNDHVLQRLTVPLNVTSPMTASTRELTDVSIEVTS